MAKTTLFKGVVHLTQEQYNKLIALGAIEVNGMTIQYDEGTLYVTPNVLPDDYYTKDETKELIKTQIVSGDKYIIVDEGKPGTASEGKLVIELDKTNVETEKAIENSDKLITSGAAFNSVSDKVSAVAKYNTNIVGTTTVNNEDGFVGVSAKDTVEDGAESGMFTAGIQLSDTIDTSGFTVYGVNADTSKVAQLYVGLDEISAMNNTKVKIDTPAKQVTTENTKLIQNKNGLYYVKPTDTVASVINPEEVNSPEIEVVRKSDLEGISGGSKLYMHYISEQDKIFYCRYISSSPTVLTVDTFLTLLHQYPTSFIVDAKSGRRVSMESTPFVYGLSSDGTSLTVSTYTLIGESNGFGGGEIIITSATSSNNYSNTAIHITDTVTEL